MEVPHFLKFQGGLANVDVMGRLLLTEGKIGKNGQKLADVIWGGGGGGGGGGAFVFLNIPRKNGQRLILNV